MLEFFFGQIVQAVIFVIVLKLAEAIFERNKSA